jgi:5,10-methylene-tetrahydrofolate dehydrogenase/methenyl tetrahydrofolate cyclohydrolase
MDEIAHEKLIDWRAVASELDAQCRQATSAIREQLGSVPKIVEVAYTNSDFGKIDEECFEETANIARWTGVVYEVDRLYLKDGEAAAAVDLCGRLSVLSSDPSVDGICVHAAYWGVREHPHDINWITPRKDIGCNTSTSDWRAKRPDSFIHPTVGSILKVLSHALKRRPLTEVSVALLKAPGDWRVSYSLTLLAAALRCRSMLTCIDPSQRDADRIRQADAIVTQVDKPGYLDERYVRQGQIVIDLGGRWNSTFKGDLDLDSIRSAAPLIEAYANWVTVGNLELRITFLNAIRSFLLKQEKEVVSRLMPLIELA